MPENKMMASAIATISHAVSIKNEKINNKDIKGQLTNELSNTDSLEKIQEEAKTIVSEKVSSVNLGGLETKVIEQIDESIGKVLNSQIIETGNELQEDNDNEYKNPEMGMS